MSADSGPRRERRSPEREREMWGGGTGWVGKKVESERERERDARILQTVKPSPENIHDMRAPAAHTPAPTHRENAKKSDRARKSQTGAFCAHVRARTLSTGTVSAGCAAGSGSVSAYPLGTSHFS